MVQDESRAGGAGGGRRPSPPVGSVTVVVSTVVLSPPAQDGQYLLMCHPNPSSCPCFWVIYDICLAQTRYIVAGTFGLPVVLLITACGSMQKRDCRHKGILSGRNQSSAGVSRIHLTQTRGLLVALTASICA